MGQLIIKQEMINFKPKPTALKGKADRDLNLD